MKTKTAAGLERRVETSDSVVLSKKPLVSVLMLAYNHGPFLADAIDGVLKQRTNFPIELLIGEDCSSDNTLDIALAYQRSHPNVIRVLTATHNVGMQENLRRLLEVARGQFVAFCEGDDYWIDDNKLSLQVDCLRKNPSIDLSFHSCMTQHEGGRELGAPCCVRASNDAVIDLKQVISGLGGFMPTASLLIRRSACMHIPRKVLKASPAADYFLQIYGARRGGAYYLNRSMSVYRSNLPGSWTASVRSPQSIFDFQKRFFHAIDLVRRDFPGHGRSFDRMTLRWYLARIDDTERAEYTALSDLHAEDLQKRNLHARTYVMLASLLKPRRVRKIVVPLKTVIAVLKKVGSAG